MTKALQNMDRTLPKELFFHGSNPSTPYFREKSIYENAPEKSGADKRRNRAFARFRGTILILSCTDVSAWQKDDSRKA